MTDYGIIVWSRLNGSEFYTFMSDGDIISRPMDEIERMTHVFATYDAKKVSNWLTNVGLRSSIRILGFPEEIATEICGFDRFVRI